MRVKELTMAQPNESDLSTKFSTLNVNAMEFVPSFCSSQPSATPSAETESPPEQLSPTIDVEVAVDSDVPPPTTVPEPTGTPSEELTTTTATTTELIDDKTPENPGESERIDGVWMFHFD